MPARGRLSKAVVKFTANFEANLDSIEVFWTKNEAPQACDKLLDELDTTVVPNLAQYPLMGRLFLTQSARSVEALERLEEIKHLTGHGELREFILSDYLILYTIIDSSVYLLAIKHHKQLSFDFKRLWSG
jgi:plasmid stabilization system protein ParE